MLDPELFDLPKEYEPYQPSEEEQKRVNFVKNRIAQMQQ